MNETNPQTILGFWFSERCRPLWFNSNPAFDLEIKQRFEKAFKDAQNDLLAHWRNSANGCLALVILLDQFPLNMYRGLPQSFSGEKKSREIARHALDQYFDRYLNGEQKAFLYMPFMHSEHIEDQDLAVTLFDKAGLKENLRYAIHHRDIVRRFGRFPHRNAILNRPNSRDEIEYLASDKAFLG